jgi:hypothetical protein
MVRGSSIPTAVAFLGASALFGFGQAALGGAAVLAGIVIWRQRRRTG